MSLTRYADTLRQIARRLEVPPLPQQTAQPGVNEAIRVSIYTHDSRWPSSVGTLQRGLGDSCSLVVIYDVYDRDNVPYRYDFNVPLARYQTLLMVFRKNRFDHLDDAPNIPLGGVDLWLVERASGTFHHDVVLCPQQAMGHHRELMLAIRQHLSEAVRQLTL